MYVCLVQYCRREWGVGVVLVTKKWPPLTGELAARLHVAAASQRAQGQRHALVLLHLHLVVVVLVDEVPQGSGHGPLHLLVVVAVAGQKTQQLGDAMEVEHLVGGRAETHTRADWFINQPITRQNQLISS